MTEVSNEPAVYSLFQVTKSIEKILSERFTSSYWIKAEMNKLNLYRQSGHCYPELVEKKDGKVIAQMKANLWRDDYLMVNRKFQRILREPLKDGIKILFLARITFDSCHGISLRILDIDPNYTLGDLEQEKRASIERLKAERLFDLNRTLQLPVLPKRLAIISVESSKGYADFLSIINSNPAGYRFFHVLFPSVLQGDRAVGEITWQLQRIKHVRHHFDVVLIIRGGGGDIGLSAYNSYELAKEIAHFPLPVLTGIGHATNETVTEMVSHTNAITPTKVAELLLKHFDNFALPVAAAQRTIIDKSKLFVETAKVRLYNDVKLFKSVTYNALQKNNNSVHRLHQELTRQSDLILKQQSRSLRDLQLGLGDKAVQFSAMQLLHLNHMQKQLDNLNPVNVLRRGYSITRVNGKALQTPVGVQEGDRVETQLFEGTLKSVVVSDNQKENE